MFNLIYFNLTGGRWSHFFPFFTAHAVMRKWVLLTDPDDKMAGVKVRKKGLGYISICCGSILSFV